MSKWVKFRDEIPEDGMNLWVSDGDKVWPELAYSEEDRKNEHNLFWMDRINPAPPEKERHDCHRASNKGNFYCYEEKCGDFVLEHDGGFINIKFCPFCGFTPEKK